MRTARQLSIGICMLDWPAQNQTSPTRTSWRVTELPPVLRVSVCFLKDAFGVRILTDQLPSASARAVSLLTLQEGLTLTVAPGAALPHTGTLHCCWSTMWSVNKGLSCTWATAGIVMIKRKNAVKTAEANRFISILFVVLQK